MSDPKLSPEVLDFIVWMVESNIQLSRPGSYSLSYDQLETAWKASRRGVDAFAELDLLIIGKHEAETNLAFLSPEDMATAERIIAGESTWGAKAEPWLLEAIERTEVALSYKRRRDLANRHIARREVRQRIFTRDGFACIHCGAVEFLAIDHIVAVANGGTDDDGNLQTLCIRCNSRKGAR